MNPVAVTLRGAVVAYQWTLRPILGCNCRFHPSCSDYALGALKTHGALRGTALAGWRVLRCNPWNAAVGFDPVPPPRSGQSEAPRSGQSPAPRSGPNQAPRSGQNQAPRSGRSEAPRSG